jgi:hypothetical protein
LKNLLSKKSLLVVLILCLAFIPVGILIGQNSESSFVVSSGPDGALGTEDDMYVDSSGNVARGVAPMDLNSPTLLASAGAGEAGEQSVAIPDIEIPEGEALAFKGDDYLYLTAEDLLSPLDLDLKVDELGRPDLIGGSLYVPASVGDLMVTKGNQAINWEVTGDIVLETDIAIRNYSQVSLLSHNGDVVFNNVSITGEPNPYAVNITAENGSIEANGTTINLRGAESGIIKLVAQNDINLTSADISSAGDVGVNIQSDDGSIDASKATISSTSGGSSIDIQSSGQINVSEATVTCKGSGGLSIISEAEGIDASKATISSTNGGSSIDIQSSGQINVSETMVTCKGNGGLSIISEAEDIDASKATISSTNGRSSIDIQSSGQINVSEATVTCKGSGGLSIISEAEGIDASNATIKSTNSAPTAAVTIQTAGFIDLDGATVSSNGSPDPALLIESTNDGVSAKNADLATTYSGKSLEINAQGLVELEQATVSSAGDINIITNQDIRCVSADITATGWGNDLCFESTGVGSKLWVNNANLGGRSILAVGLQVQGVPASGEITMQ